MPVGEPAGQSAAALGRADRYHQDLGLILHPTGEHEADGGTGPAGSARHMADDGPVGQQTFELGFAPAMREGERMDGRERYGITRRGVEDRRLRAPQQPGNQAHHCRGRRCASCGRASG